MRAVLHIGHGKTGTTALEGFLRQNRDALAARGVLFSRAMGEENHLALAAHAQADVKSGLVDPMPDGPNPDRGHLEGAMVEASTGPLPDLPQAFRDEVMALSRPGDARVTGRWFGGRHEGPGDPPFGDGADRRPRAELRPPTPEGAAQTAARLWARRQRQIRAPRAENERLRRAAATGIDR